MMSQGGQLLQKLNVSETLLQRTSIPPVKRQDSAGKSRIGSRTLTPSKVVVE